MIETKNHDLEELQRKLEEVDRTEYLTLPNIPKNQDPVVDAESARERERILNPAHEDNVEIRKRMAEGWMPKDAPKSALASIGKHEIAVQDLEIVIEKPEIKTLSENVEIVIDREGLAIPVDKVVEGEKVLDAEKSAVENKTPVQDAVKDNKTTNFTNLMPKAEDKK